MLKNYNEDRTHIIDNKMAELQTVNEDLRNERTKCTFNQEELTNFIDGGAENTDMRRNIGTYLYNIIYLYTIHPHNIFYVTNMYLPI